LKDRTASSVEPVVGGVPKKRRRTLLAFKKGGKKKTYEARVNLNSMIQERRPCGGGMGNFLEKDPNG